MNKNTYQTAREYDVKETSYREYDDDGYWNYIRYKLTPLWFWL